MYAKGFNALQEQHTLKKCDSQSDFYFYILQNSCYVFSQKYVTFLKSEKVQSNQVQQVLKMQSYSFLKKAIKYFSSPFTSCNVEEQDSSRTSNLQRPGSASRSQVKSAQPLISQQPKTQSSSQVQIPQPVVPSQPVLQVSAVQPIANSPKIITVTIQNIKGLKTKVQFNESDTGLSIKSYIYANITNSLEIHQMSLEYQGTKIGNYKKLSQLQIVVGTQLKIVQQKADVSEISSIISDIHGEDLISGEVGTVKMSCGHNIGRDTMTSFVRSLITSNLYQIKCPHPDDNGGLCNSEWDFKDCKKIGVFTKQEIQEFEKGLSQNWIKQFAKPCPKCKETVCKGDLKTNRVVCPSCKYGDFCFLCLNKWIGGNVCGNEECKFLATFIENAQFNRKFELFNKAQNKTMQYMTPQYRACPHCSLIIEHREACKHMTCKSCTKKFCWVCLGVLNKDKTWSCGAYNEYCGKVAQRQKIGINI